MADLGHTVPLQLEEMQALIEVVEEAGVVDPNLDTAYHKLIRHRDRVIELEIKTMRSQMRDDA